MARILITGTTGMLGTYVLSDLQKFDHDIVIGDRARFDLDLPLQMYEGILNVAPDVIVHLAAETDVDLCERVPMHAGVRNHLATDMVAKAARECGAWILYMSTSNVFGYGRGLVYTEIDIPNPENYYGRSKLMGELAIRMHCPTNHMIVRGGWMIGGGLVGDHKFVGKILRQMQAGQTKIRAVQDKFGSITSAKALSEFIVWAVANRPTGTVHFASKGMVTRCDIARAIGGEIGFSGEVDGVSSPEFPLSAPRPMSEAIESIYMPLLDGAPQPGHWKDDLVCYVRDLLVQQQGTSAC